MASTAVLFASGLVGFTPAIAVMYHALRTYDYPFTEKAYFNTARVFLAFAVGMVLGTASGAITVGLGAVSSLSLVSLLVALLLLVLFEELVKLVYLNRKGYRGRFDSTFYGLGMGVGIAALVAAGNAYVNGDALLAPGPLLLLGVLSASLVFVHASTGAIIGFGCSKGEVTTAFAQALIARILHAAMLVPFIVWSALGRTDLAIPLFALSAAAAFTFFVYRYVYRHVLPETLPPELRRERRRDLRNVGDG